MTAIPKLPPKGLGGPEIRKNEAACAADATREVVERWLPSG